MSKPTQWNTAGVRLRRLFCWLEASFPQIGCVMTTFALPSINAMPTRLRQRAALAPLSVARRSLVEEALTVDFDYVKNDVFRKASTERELFDEGIAINPASTSWYHPMVDEKLVGRSISASSLLNVEQERHLFLRYNYARFRSQAAVKRFRTHPSQMCAGEIARWYDRVRDTRELITQANLALVLAMAKRTRVTEVDFCELVSEGNMALLRALEKFDVARGFKFSTYACRAILQAFSRIAVKTSRYRQAFPAEFNPVMERSDYQETRRAGIEQDAVEELRQIVGENRAQLSEVECAVIQSRFGISRGGENSTMTLEEVGHVTGVSKERVRQIQNNALAKLRVTIDNEASVG